MWDNALDILIIMAVPSAVTGFAFWLIEKKMEGRERMERERQAEQRTEDEKKEEAMVESRLIILKSVNAAIALSEATAKAVERIPDAHCNGDMKAAMEYAKAVKHEQRDFLARHGIQNIFDTKGGVS